MKTELHEGDCLEILRFIPDNSVHACVTDPPYGLAFMGKKWDYDVPGEDVWREVLRILKPGGFLLSFSGTRTYHRMTVRIEDAGFEIRDMIQWLYGSGFPKSHDVSKAIDREAGALGTQSRGFNTAGGKDLYDKQDKSFRSDYGAEPYEGRTDAAKQWEGFGTALKPANEPICVARKPLIGTVAQNVLAHGCGGLNIDACRVGCASDIPSVNATRRSDYPQSYTGECAGWGRSRGGLAGDKVNWEPNGGRWPANVVHDGSDEACAGMGESSRYFYSAKASRAERNMNVIGPNDHPTVKPVGLMRWLVRMVCPPGGTVIDPYAGSGTTGVACKMEGFGFIGIDRDDRYIAIARQRIGGATFQPGQVQR